MYVLSVFVNHHIQCEAEMSEWSPGGSMSSKTCLWSNSPEWMTELPPQPAAQFCRVLLMTWLFDPGVLKQRNLKGEAQRPLGLKFDTSALKPFCWSVYLTGSEIKYQITSIIFSSKVLQMFVWKYISWSFRLKQTLDFRITACRKQKLVSRWQIYSLFYILQSNRLQPSNMTSHSWSMVSWALMKQAFCFQ